jgi:hypothetical protein
MVECRCCIWLSMADLEQRAIEILKERRRPRRPSNESAKVFPDLRTMPNINGGSNLKGMPSIVGMKEWLHELGYLVLVGRILVRAVSDIGSPPTSITSISFTLRERKGREAHVHLLILF